MKTKHTQGEWTVIFLGPQEDDGESDFFIEAKEPKNHIGKIEIMMEDFGDHNGYPREQRLADAKLIAAAPYALKSIMHSYVKLQQVANREVRFSAHTDGIRASLRDVISEMTGIGDEEVQLWCERIAVEYYGKDTWPAIEEAFKQ